MSPIFNVIERKKPLTGTVSLRPFAFIITSVMKRSESRRLRVLSPRKATEQEVRSIERSLRPR
jgi:uncharacterized DUF497 family protein